MSNKCVLQLLNMYFSKFDFSQQGDPSNTEYNTSFRIEYSKNDEDKNKYRVTIDSAISNKSGSITLNLQTVGIFKIDSDRLEDSEVEQIIEKNTVAIMFPFIRSQISLLTTQPGITPVLLPPININSLIENK